MRCQELREAIIRRAFEVSGFVLRSPSLQSHQRHAKRIREIFNRFFLSECIVSFEKSRTLNAIPILPRPRRRNRSLWQHVDLPARGGVPKITKAFTATLCAVHVADGQNSVDPGIRAFALRCCTERTNSSLRSGFVGRSPATLLKSEFLSIQSHHTRSELAEVVGDGCGRRLVTTSAFTPPCPLPAFLTFRIQNAHSIQMVVFDASEISVFCWC
jgi:hypothetical protein